MDRPWNCELVKRELAAAFGALRAPTVTGGGALHTVDLEGGARLYRISGAELIAIAQRLLPDRDADGRSWELERSALTVWAKNRARLAELTIPQFCVRRDLSRQGFDKARDRGATHVAEGIIAHRLLLDWEREAAA